MDSKVTKYMECGGKSDATPLWLPELGIGSYGPSIEDIFERSSLTDVYSLYGCNQFTYAPDSKSI